MRRHGDAPVKSILVVDDEFGMVGVLTAILEDAGYRVFSAANGRQALARLSQSVPDVVLTDYMMPLLDGAELGRAMQASPEWQAVPIVMMSAVPEESVRAEFKGYRAFLRKPFDIPKLLQALERALGG